MSSVRKIGPRYDVAVISVSVTCAAMRSRPSARAARVMCDFTR
ncbi:Uncharacterised protein [Mycobacteroides abscessus]|nr:Uncharacterised protein [Mycobacteroides abscessus]